MPQKNNANERQSLKGSNTRFVPRIVNPVKIKKAVIFSAEELVRNAAGVLRENMPWIDCRILSDPVSVSNFQSDEATVFLFDDTSLTFIDAAKIHKANKDAVIVLLSSNDFLHRSPRSAAEEKYPHTASADLIFAINSSEFLPDRILTSVVRCAEDLLNIEKYTKVRRYIFLIVDDEPRWFSQFLSVLYQIIGQRADVKVTRTYEETLEFLFGVEHESKIDKTGFLQKGHGDDVVCMITDVFFPRGSDLHSQAGVDLIRLMNRFYPRIPAIIASKAKEAEDMKGLAFILPKGDPGSIQTFRDYIYDHTGLGDFLVTDSRGKVLHRAKHIKDVVEIFLEAEKDTPQALKLRALLEDYGRRDSFSTWLYMHGFRELGDRLRPVHLTGQRMISVLKNSFEEEIQRMDRTPLLIEGKEIFDLPQLAHALRSADPKQIQKLSDTDTFSTWLDRKCYPELAEELRPIHKSGEKLRHTLADVMDKWTRIYAKKKN
jgi:hypothetical protein